MDYGPPTTDHGIRNTERGTRKTVHGTRYTKRGTRNAEHRKWSTGHETRYTEHEARNTENGTRNAEHGRRNTEGSVGSRGHGRASSRGHGRASSRGRERGRNPTPRGDRLCLAPRPGRLQGRCGDPRGCGRRQRRQGPGKSRHRGCPARLCSGTDAAGSPAGRCRGRRCGCRGQCGCRRVQPAP